MFARQRNVSLLSPVVLLRPPVAPKSDGSNLLSCRDFGAMEAILEELTPPAVVAAIAAQSPDVVGKSADLSAPVRACLCLLGDMMWPARVEDQLVENNGTPFTSLHVSLIDNFWLAWLPVLRIRVSRLHPGVLARCFLAE